VLLIELAVLTAAGFTRAREEWEKSVVLWGGFFFFVLFLGLELNLLPSEKRQERVKAEADLSPCPDALGLNNTLVGADTVRHVAEDAGSGSGVEQDHWSGVDGAAGGGPTAGKDREGKDGGGKEGKDKDKDGTGKDPLPPTRKYRMTEEMKGVLWQLVMLSNDVCRLENEKKCAFF
jgi:hypothetical protein